jgi:nucleoside-diphosphate-sugar epimerase
VRTWSSTREGSLLGGGATRPFGELLFGMDAWIHCAWSSTDFPGYRHSPDHLLWAQRTLELVEVASRAGAFSILYGSVFDRTGRTLENRSDAYALAKGELRRAIEDAALVGDSVCLISPPYIFSPADRRPGVMRSFLSGGGDWSCVQEPDAAHDFLHVQDVVGATMKALACRSSGVLEIDSGRLHTVRELLDGLGHERPCDGGCARSSVGPRRYKMSAPYTDRYFHGRQHG